MKKNIGRKIIVGDDEFGSKKYLNTKLKDIHFTGLKGQLWSINYIPEYMLGWRLWQINIACWILNRLPIKIRNKVEFLLSKI